MTKQELDHHWELLQHLTNSQELLDSLRAAAAPRVAKLTGMPHAPGIRDPVGDLAAEIADTSARIEILKAEIEKSEKLILDFIAEIEDDQTRTIFRLRFIRGLSWKEVSQILGKYTTESSVKTICYRYIRKNL